MKIDAILWGLHDLKEEQLTRLDHQRLELGELGHHFPPRIKVRLQEEVAALLKSFHCPDMLVWQEATIIWNQFKRLVAMLFWHATDEEGRAFQADLNRALAKAINDIYSLAITLDRVAQILEDDELAGREATTVCSAYDDLAGRWQRFQDGGEDDNRTYFQAGIYRAAIEMPALVAQFDGLQVPPWSRPIRRDELKEKIVESIQALLDKHFNEVWTKSIAAVRSSIHDQFDYIVSSVPDVALLLFYRNSCLIENAAEAYGGASAATVSCPNCGAENIASNKFCHACGYAFLPANATG